MKDVPSALETPAAPHTSPAVGYRDLAVHLDGSPEDEYRVAHAESLAVSFGGHLVGLYTNPLPSPASFASNFGVTTLGKLTEAAMAAGDAAESSLRHRLARLGTDQELRRIQGRAGFFEQSVIRAARCADLFVATSARDNDDMRWQAMIEGVMFEAGRGLYLIPPQSPPRPKCRALVIAWVDSRCSARAVAEAMPLIVQAANVHLITVQEEAHHRISRADDLNGIVSHLGRHGVVAEASILTPTTAPTDAILDFSLQVQADLIVAGAYGHSRFREWVLGGVTRDLLSSSPVPLLMAH